MKKKRAGLPGQKKLKMLNLAIKSLKKTKCSKIKKG